MKAVVATFNQEKAQVGAFSVIVQPVVEPMDRFAALPGADHVLVLHKLAGRSQDCLKFYEQEEYWGHQVQNWIEEKSDSNIPL